MATTTSSSSHYDVIIIGSGIGGSTAGILLARYFRKRVLLIEKHWQFGGLTHEFSFDGRSFATGVHYIGGVQNDSVPDKLFDIITDGKISWLPMPHRYDDIILPNYRYAFPASKSQLLAELSAQFPQERAALTQFMKDVEKAFRFLATAVTIRSFVPQALNGLIGPLKRLCGFDPNISLQAYLDQRIQDPTLKALLAAQWCDYGVLPGEASFMVHAMVFKHYLEGAYYPAGGPARIAQGMLESLIRYGAEVRLNTAVTRILTRGKRAYGVETQTTDGERASFTADQIISNAGAVATYQNLLASHKLDMLPQPKSSLSARYDFFSIYLSLSESPAKMGFDGSNKWIFRSLDHTQAILPPTHPDFPGFYCLLFPSLKARDTENHTMEILTMVDYEAFRPWEGSTWKQRDDAYYALKDQITTRILADVESRYPGLGSLIRAYDSSTPLSTEKFLSRKQGSSYGIPFTTQRMEMDWLSNTTPIRNLYLSGQDAFGPGIMGAMMGGLGAAAKALGTLGYMRIMRNLIRHRMPLKSTEPSSPLTLQVRQILPETPEAYTIEFEPNPKLAYQSGQFLVLDVPVKGKHLKRSYSLSSSPDEPFPTLTIKRIPKGIVSHQLEAELKPGDSIQASFPKGDFFIQPEDKGKDLILIAAGSGITPLFSLLKDTLANQVDNRIQLFYASKSPELTIFRDQLDQLAAEYPAYLHITYCYSQQDTATRQAGRLTAQEVLRGFPSYDLDRTLVYVCAPGEMVFMLKTALGDIGFPAAHFHYESFTAADVSSPDQAVDSMAAQVTYLHRGKQYFSQSKAGESLLSPMRREQMPLDHSCMSGDCEVCRCHLVAGKVISVKGQKRVPMQAGSAILPCISYAQSEEVVLAQ